MPRAKPVPDLIVPAKVRREAGIRPNDKIEFKVSRRKITIVAKPDEYTPAQRRAIDARLTKARKGPYHGPFASADKAMDFVEDEIARRNGRKTLIGG